MKISVPNYIQTLNPYVPGKPIEETKRELGLDDVIKLASNENPLGPSPKAIEAVQKELSDSHRYPDASGFYLKKKISDRFDVEPENLLLGNGSNEVIDLLIRTFTIPGDSIVTSKAAFIAYRIGAQSHGVHCIETSLKENYEFDLDAIYSEVGANESVKMVFIANPNNPTGTYVSDDVFGAFMEKIQSVGRDVLVVLDSAYLEYVTAEDYPDPFLYQKKFSNIIVTHTFSKVYGLGGVRVGFGVGQAELISYAQRIREPFNVSSYALAAAEAALSDLDFVEASKKQNEVSKKFWEAELEKMGVPYYPSQGNFVLIDVKKGFGKTPQEVFEFCLKEGVIFRPVQGYGLVDELRVTFGLDVENQRAVKVLGQLKA